MTTIRTLIYLITFPVALLLCATLNMVSVICRKLIMLHVSHNSTAVRP